MHVLTVDNVSFSYDPAVPILRDVSLTVRKGEFLSLVGPNQAAIYCGVPAAIDSFRSAREVFKEMGI